MHTDILLVPGNDDGALPLESWRRTPQRLERWPAWSVRVEPLAYNGAHAN